jgi:hypothetical protein
MTLGLPPELFNGVLEGLSVDIYGNRSRILKVSIGRFNVIKLTVSFLNSISSSSKNTRLFKERHCSIGAGILNRFKIWFDYPNQQIILRKNGSFSKEFNYNVSGLDVVYDG